jgi:hypothetical protein
MSNPTDRSTTMRTISRSIAAGLAVTAVAIAPGAALARHGADDRGGDDRGGDRDRREVRVAGDCSDGSSAKLKAKHDDGRIETEFEVDQNRSGVRWRVQVRRDGRVVVRTHATTRGPSGSFSVERHIGNGAGSDRIVARAVSPSGEVCRAALTL